MAKTSIEWATDVWNPTRGCTRVSPGCGGPGPHGGCYAEKIAARFSGPGMPFDGYAKMVSGEARWTGKVELIEEKLMDPLRWRKPRRIFVNSMSDLFHEGLPDEAIDRVFAVMALAPRHTFQILTKRPERMRAYIRQDRMGYIEGRAKRMLRDRAGAPLKPVLVGKTLAGSWPWPHVWLGTSVEDQARADERIPLLLQTPAAVRWISAEPLLGPVDLKACWMRPMTLCGECPSSDEGTPIDCPSAEGALDWVVVGSESGPRARPCDEGWVRQIRDQCSAAGVPFFWKQHVEGGRKISLPELDGVRHDAYPDAVA